MPKKFSGESFEAKAYKAGVQVYSAERFIVGNAKPMAAVRLSATAPGNNEKLKKAMKILRNILEEWGIKYCLMNSYFPKIKKLQNYKFCKNFTPI